jgi:hypothetical protein
VQRAGPKDARLRFEAHPLLRYRYHGIGIRAHVEKVISLCAQRVYVTEIRSERTDDAMTLLARWV